MIGDFVTLAPNVKCNIVIEYRAYTGAGVVIMQGKPSRSLIIGRGAVVGMGAVVTRDVRTGTTIFGILARALLSNTS